MSGTKTRPEPGDFIKSPCPNAEFVADDDAPQTYCSHCDKQVVNLSLMTEEDAKRWSSENPGSCVTVAKDREGLIFRQRIPAFFYAAAFAVAVTSSAGYAYIAVSTLQSDMTTEPFSRKLIQHIDHMASFVFDDQVVQKFDGGNDHVREDVVF